ncbi:MAG: NifB/NifX family molybdenum-iron cluster-binding protein [Desulfamplus sp.]|nr:NifB/NifX family molybdenum-iron cluster-binding protein [Desulfamplus sp.]
MKIALTAWEDKISPVFDAAKTLLIVEIKDSKVVSRSVERFNQAIISNLADMLSRMSLLKVDLLICGAISTVPAAIIEANGLKVISFISGNIEDVIAAYTKDESIRDDAIISTFAMPGCGRRHRGNLNKRYFTNNIKEVRVMPKGNGNGSCSRGGQGGGCGNKGGKGGGGQGCGNKGGRGGNQGGGNKGGGRGQGQGGGGN